MQDRVPIVLVHGAWAGAWIWRRVLQPLRAAGHEVHAVTLTGDGERAHLRRADIDLATHAADVLGLVQAEELAGFVLVGHSYGGMVVTAAADAIVARLGAHALRGLAYVDAVVPLPGRSWSSGHSAETVAERLALAAANDNALPPADPAAFGLQGAERDWLLRRQVPHPFGMYLEPVRFDPVRLAPIPRLFVDCTRPALPTIDASRRLVRAQPGWRVVEIATGHCPMVSAPQALAQHLLDFARAAAA
ncbi:MAG TPA: alpha/beta hydrolase [Rubrivivax sp.]|jgi:pimeloyl-ACP methyl ester carboxylesterase|nr:alpha/beta hydrolase [Pseudomonadota bacterium]HOL37107.1 alpha/beta hydrolase [Rubrivivax sp.]HPP83695.1 alpha/beta hydrolase [Rubrivivax sp.]